ncbi:ribosomal protein S18-alanine N-acetyltransferase [Chloroflexota bacterium]
MPYSVHPMCREDIAQINEIDREAFSSQWPQPNYLNELQNQLAHYIVVYDDVEKVEVPRSRIRSRQWFARLASRIRRRLGQKPSPDNARLSSLRSLVTGFAGIWVLADEAHITNIAVRQRYLRRGIGELMLVCLIDLADEMKAEMLTLEVRASNTTAQQLYAKYGFEEVGLRKHYYLDNREDALLMSTENIHAASFQAQLQGSRKAYTEKWGDIRLVNISLSRPGK